MQDVSFMKTELSAPYVIHWKKVTVYSPPPHTHLHTYQKAVLQPDKRGSILNVRLWCCVLLFGFSAKCYKELEIDFVQGAEPDKTTEKQAALFIEGSSVIIRNQKGTWATLIGACRATERIVYAYIHQHFSSQCFPPPYLNKSQLPTLHQNRQLWAGKILNIWGWALGRDLSSL